MKRRLHLTGNLLTGALTRAEYTLSDYHKHHGNPLIEALPLRWNREEAMDRLRINLDFDASERKLDHVDRIYRVQELIDFFEPLPRHMKLESTMSDALRLGLSHRNPLDPNYWIEVDDNENLILNSLEGSQSFDHTKYRRRSLRLAIPFLGDSGGGKSVSTELIAGLYPQVIIHQAYPDDLYNLIDGFIQVVWVKLEIPANGSLRTLCIDFFRAVDSTLQFQNTKYEKMYVGSVATMLSNIGRLVGLHGIGLIIIDELQRLVNSRDQNKVMSFFEALINIVGIPVMVVGTEDAYDLLSETFSTARRLTGTRGLTDWKRLEKDVVFEYFLDCLWDYQYTSVETPLSDELIEIFYYETQGVIDLIVKLYIMVQAHIMNENERDPDYPEIITPEIVKEVAKRGFKHLQTKLREIRGGQDTSFKPDELRRVDIEVMLHEYVEKMFEHKLEGLEILKKQKNKQNSKRKKSEPKKKKKAPPETSPEYKILPGGLLEAYHDAVQEEISKYVIFRERGFVHDLEGFEFND